MGMPECVVSATCKSPSGHFYARFTLADYKYVSVRIQFTCSLHGSGRIQHILVQRRQEYRGGERCTCTFVLCGYSVSKLHADRADW